MRRNSKQLLAALIALAIGAVGAEGTDLRDKPLVVNGDLALTTIDFDAYMQRVPADRRDEFRAEFEKINPTVDGLWLRRVMAARAREAGLDKDALVQARIRLAAEDILAEAYILDVAKKAKVPDLNARARELYKARLKDFTSPELITAEHILISMKNYPREIAAQRAQEVYQRAKNGEDFAKLAAQYTDNPASIDINGMPLASFAAPLPEAVSKLKTGEIMPPVETQFGFHLIKMGDRIPPKVKPFEQVKDDLIALEKQKFVDEEKTAAIEAIRADPKTTLHLENVRALKSDFKMPSAEEIAKIKPNIRY
jgi:peptidyl-prolyl cis-trans isomerase C